MYDHPCEVREDPPCASRAAWGLRVCEGHLTAGRRALASVWDLDHDLTRLLAGATSRAPSVGYVRHGGSPSVGVHLSDALVRTRDLLVTDLWDLAAYVAETRGVDAPLVRDAPTLAGFLLGHTSWMSANPTLAPVWVGKVGSAVADAHRHAYPVQPTGVALGTCNADVGGQPCGRTIRGTRRSRAVACRGCGRVGTLEDWARWIDVTPAPADDVIRFVASQTGVALTRQQLRNWRNRGKVRGYGNGHRGQPPRYNPLEVLAVVRDDPRTRPVGGHTRTKAHQEDVGQRPRVAI